MAAIRQCQASETCTPPPPQARIRTDSPSWRHNLPNLIPLWAFMINGVTVVWQSAAVAFGFDCQKRERQGKKKSIPVKRLVLGVRGEGFCFPLPPRIFTVLKGMRPLCQVLTQPAESHQKLAVISDTPGASIHLFPTRWNLFRRPELTSVAVFFCFLQEHCAANLVFNNLLQIFLTHHLSLTALCWQINHSQSGKKLESHK